MQNVCILGSHYMNDIKRTGMYVVKEGRAMQYLFTERAHLMCPNMCFGIVMAACRPYEGSKIRATIAALAEAHPAGCPEIYSRKQSLLSYHRKITGRAFAAGSGGQGDR